MPAPSSRQIVGMISRSVSGRSTVRYVGNAFVWLMMPSGSSSKPARTPNAGDGDSSTTACCTPNRSAFSRPAVAMKRSHGAGACISLGINRGNSQFGILIPVDEHQPLAEPAQLRAGALDADADADAT